MKPKDNKKKPGQYCQIVITDDGGIFIEPFGEAARFLLKNLKASGNNKKINELCG